MEEEEMHYKTYRSIVFFHSGLPRAGYCSEFLPSAGHAGSNPAGCGIFLHG